MEDLTQVEEEEELIFSAKELQNSDMSSAGEFLRLFQSALKDFKLYPEGSRIRDKVVEHICQSLNGLFETYPVINMSEVEKSLIVNKRRITSRLAKFVDIDSILTAHHRRPMIHQSRHLGGISYGRVDCFKEFDGVHRS